MKVIDFINAYDFSYFANRGYDETQIRNVAVDLFRLIGYGKNFELTEPFLTQFFYDVSSIEDSDERLLQIFGI